MCEWSLHVCICAGALKRSEVLDFQELELWAPDVDAKNQIQIIWWRTTELSLQQTEIFLKLHLHKFACDFSPSASEFEEIAVSFLVIILNEC